MSEPVSIQDFGKLDLRVGQVTAVEFHPNADKLLVLKVDLGPLGERQLVAGLKGYYEADDLVGRKIIVIVNLEPATLRGVESQGMLLAAAGDDASQVVFLTPEKDIAPGSRVR
jgi:methionine--tRNA ligase beta chain